MADTMQGLKRTHYCGEVLPSLIGETVVVTGWVQKIRDLGNLVFIDLRDRSGILQLAFDDGTDRAVFAKAETVRGEYVLLAKGTLAACARTPTPELPTGLVELAVEELRVLSQAQTPPFEITDQTNVKEELAAQIPLPRFAPRRNAAGAYAAPPHRQMCARLL